MFDEIDINQPQVPGMEQCVYFYLMATYIYVVAGKTMLMPHANYAIELPVVYPIHPMSC